jgi:hypothetical protein
MAKLTVNVDAKVVERAKRYAADRGTSLSRLIETYLDQLARRLVPPGRGSAAHDAAAARNPEGREAQSPEAQSPGARRPSRPEIPLK